MQIFFYFFISKRKPNFGLEKSVSLNQWFGILSFFLQATNILSDSMFVKTICIVFT